MRVRDLNAALGQSHFFGLWRIMPAAAGPLADTAKAGDAASIARNLCDQLKHNKQACPMVKVSAVTRA